jgi:uncharacterized protein YndB with AHSA1/START domain
MAEGERRTLVFVRDLRHPPERVWTALTDPEQLRAWSPYTADRSLARPGDATLTMFAGADEEGDRLPATVSRAEPPRVLEYTLGSDLLRWQLEPHGEGTRLTLSHTVAGDDWVPKVAAGWHLCLDVAERLLDGSPVTPIRGEEAMEHGWQELHDAYAERLGIAL